MSANEQPTLNQLVDLFARTRSGDAEARAALDGWFQRAGAAMRAGRQARDELESLAYLVVQRDADRQLRAGGRFGNLGRAHDPGSVAYRHRERLAPFCRALEEGEGRTAEEFVGWVGELTRYVLLDMRAEDDREHSRRAEGDPADLEQADGPDRELSREEQHHLLGTLFRRLELDQFVVLLLVRFAGLTYAQAGEIMGLAEHNVAARMKRIALAVAELGEGE